MRCPHSARWASAQYQHGASCLSRAIGTREGDGGDVREALGATGGAVTGAAALGREGKGARELPHRVGNLLQQSVGEEDQRSCQRGGDGCGGRRRRRRS